MLQVDGLTKSFKTVTAVQEVSIAIPTGQMVGVIGRSGAGKSTLLRLINRLTDPTDGSIQFAGTDVTALTGRALFEWRSQCAMVFQQFNLVPRLDVLTNVLVGRLRYRGTLPSMLRMFSKAERAMAIRALDRLDMVPQALQRADTLSGGQQQRVAIARALVQQPKLVLADEPIASLDPRSAQMVMDALKVINREDRITVLCNLHTLDTARNYCERIIGMAQGRVVFDGVPEDLTSDTVREIYGVGGSGEDFTESITSTEIPVDNSPLGEAVAAVA